MKEVAPMQSGEGKGGRAERRRERVGQWVRDGEVRGQESERRRQGARYRGAVSRNRLWRKTEKGERPGAVCAG